MHTMWDINKMECVKVPPKRTHTRKTFPKKVKKLPPHGKVPCAEKSPLKNSLLQEKSKNNLKGKKCEKSVKTFFKKSGRIYSW